MRVGNNFSHMSVGLTVCKHMSVILTIIDMNDTP